MKRRLTYASIAMFLFLLLCISAVSATGTGVFNVTNASGSNGQDTVVKIYMNNDFSPKAGAITYKVYYNETLLNATSATATDGGVTPIILTSPFTVAYAKASGYSNGNTWLADVTFHVKKNIDTVTQIGLTVEELSDVALPPNDLLPDTTVQNGTFTISPVRPVANFTGTPTIGYVPLTVQFTDTSSPEGTSWTWNFGDSSTSTLQNPSHTYITTGTFTISLTATNAAGSDTFTRTSYITVNPPVADFTANVTLGKAPLAVQFTDASLGSPDAWNWSFGDGSLSTVQNPVHVYTAKGYYTVKLIVKNGTVTSNTKTGYIDVKIPPVSSFTCTPTSGETSVSVTFTDTSSEVPTVWAWNATDVTGNNTPFTFSTSKNPVQVFGVGNFLIALNATNSWGSNVSSQVTYVNVSPTVAPVADFTGSPTTGYVPLTVQFTDISTHYPTAWNWNFGDGSTGTDQNPSHPYKDVGTYNVTLNATNTAGSNTVTKTDYITVTKGSDKPEVVFYATPTTNGTAPLEVKFVDFTSNNPTTWSWTFGDDSTSTTQNPTHIYTSAGKYTVTLTATNAAGSGTLTRENYISVSSAPVASFSGVPTTGTAPLAVTFTDSSTNTPTNWNWSFGDGSVSAVQHPVHTYATNGIYTVSLTAKNSAGSNTTTKTNYITVSSAVIAPVASFSGAPTTGTAPLAVTFTDSSINAPTSWNWTFGDGSTSAVQHPVHTYATNGIYTVSLKATNSVGSNTTTKANYITVSSAVIAPVASFSGTPTSGYAPLTVTFTDSSTNTPTAWNWSFGDGSTSTLKSPSHIYTSASTYSVSLIATNSAGSNTTTKTNYITVSAIPTATSTIGTFRNGVFYLRNSNTAGPAENTFSFGQTGDKPVVGDWTGIDKDTAGVFRNGVFYLRNSNSPGNADTTFAYGQTGDIPVVGDWTGIGKDTAGIFRSGMFYLRNSNTPGPAENTFSFGLATDTPLVGDWNSDGISEVGVHRDNKFYLASSNTNGGGIVNAFTYGNVDDKPVVWNHDGKDTVGVFRNGMFYLASSNINGGGTVTPVQYGSVNDFPLTGKWI